MRLEKIEIIEHGKKKDAAMNAEILYYIPWVVNRKEALRGTREQRIVACRYVCRR
jgi:hypothetical protein